MNAHEALNHRHVSLEQFLCVASRYKDLWLEVHEAKMYMKPPTPNSGVEIGRLRGELFAAVDRLNIEATLKDEPPTFAEAIDAGGQITGIRTKSEPSETAAGGDTPTPWVDRFGKLMLAKHDPLTAYRSAGVDEINDWEDFARRLERLCRQQQEALVESLDGTRARREALAAFAAMDKGER